MFDSEKKFQGNNPVTRVQAAKMLSVFALLYTNNTIVAQTGVRSCLFWDTKSIDSGGVSAITQSCTLGLFQGYQKRFMPNQFLTNTQALIVPTKIIPNTNAVVLFMFSWYWLSLAYSGESSAETRYSHLIVLIPSSEGFLILKKITLSYGK